MSTQHWQTEHHRKTFGQLQDNGCAGHKVWCLCLLRQEF
nr:MAG TPA: hypothetical protein [Caudoviricetes sp.]